MSRDRAADGAVSADLPEPIRDWIADRAAEEGISEEELLSRLLSADGAGASLDAETVEERLAALEEAVSDLESDLDEKITDVRERVVQVKREADAKAPADHDHPDLEGRLDRALEEVESARDTVSDLDDRLEAGFTNYAVVLEHLVEVTDELDRKLDVLAEAVLDVREETDELIVAQARQAALAELVRTAHVHGASEAKCAACEETVDLGLLADPSCPHCAEPFSEFVPKEGLFGSHTLETGTPGALEDTTDGAGDVLYDLVDEPATEDDEEAPEAAEESPDSEGESFQVDSLFGGEEEAEDEPGSEPPAEEADSGSDATEEGAPDEEAAADSEWIPAASTSEEGDGADTEEDDTEDDLPEWDSLFEADEAGEEDGDETDGDDLHSLFDKDE